MFEFLRDGSGCLSALMHSSAVAYCCLHACFVLGFARNAVDTSRIVNPNIAYDMKSMIIIFLLFIFVILVIPFVF